MRELQRNTLGVVMAKGKYGESENGDRRKNKDSSIYPTNNFLLRNKIE